MVPPTQLPTMIVCLLRGLNLAHTQSIQSNVFVFCVFFFPGDDFMQTDINCRLAEQCM